MKALAPAALAAALAAAAPATAERLPIRTYTTADGLAHDRVKRIVQDTHGFLWLGTAHGLSRFDGYGFTTFGREHGLPHPSTNDVLEDGDGWYWIATNGGGVCRFSAAASRCQAYPVGETFLSNRVNVLHKDRAGRLWAGSDAGLFRLDAGRPAQRFERIEPGPAGRSDPQVLSFAEDEEGSVWVGTSAGLLRAVPDGRVLRVEVGAEGGRVRSVWRDPEGRLWVGHASGLVVLRAAPASAAAAPLSLRDRPASALGEPAAALAPGTAWRIPEIGAGSTDEVYAFVRSARGPTWIATQRGLVQLDGSRWRRLPAPHGRDQVAIIALSEDREGNLWAGTAVGVLKVSRNGLVTYDEEDGLPAERITALLEGGDGQLRVVNALGEMYRFDGERFARSGPGIPRGVAAGAGSYGQVILQDRAGDWWRRSRGGLDRLAAGGLRPYAQYTSRDGLAADNVTRVFEDSRGTLWVGAAGPEGGVIASWDRAAGAFRRHALPRRVPPWPDPYSFAQDRAGNVWVGFGREGGLVRQREGRFERVDLSTLPPGPITEIHLDREGRLWLAAGTAGLGRIDHPEAAEPRAVHYGEAQGLAGGGIYCVTEDRWGQIYLGGISGVYRLEPEIGRLKLFTTADGLVQNEQQVSFRDRQDRLWFGTMRGLSRLVPERDPPRAPPSVRVTALRIAGSAQQLSAVGESTVGPLELAPDRNQLQLEYLSVGLSSGERPRYQYRLEGADRDWSPPSGERTVNFASLRPGTYRFLVRAVNPDGLSSPRPASVSFTILAPVWRRAWFLALVSAAVGLAIHRAYRLRLRRLVELERVRTRIASDLHDDIGSNLSQIAILGEVARRRLDGEAADVAEPLALIGSLSRETVDSMSDIVWAIDPHKDRLGNLAHRMRRLASDTLGARGIALSFQAEEAAERVALGADVRRQVYLIFKESLHNAARHSACTRVEIFLGLEAARLVLQVADDGQGFDPERVADGHGLRSLQQRARALGGTLEVASGAGTRVTLRVPYRGGGEARRPT
jgi:ligand-binding sensor domain-containing protein/signal transduction histidine kinase